MRDRGTETATPPESVLRAFGVSAKPVRLSGGQGTAFRAGNAVLKPADNSAEAAWIAETFALLTGPGFRVPRPVAATDGRWILDGWTAWEHIEGAEAGRNGGRWPETVAACEAFHAALVGIPRPAFLDARSDPWSSADRIAWGEVPFEVAAEVSELAGRLAALLQPLDLPSQLVHGDFTANVLFADGLPPGVIDFSPYWRPAGFALGVIVADALTWAGADATILDLVAHVPHFPQLLVRAELRRLLEVDQHARRGRPATREEVLAHLPTVQAIERLVSERSRG